jgi:hypothetical protein
MNRQRDLLRHRSTRHQHHAILTEHLSNLAFESLDDRPLAVTVRPRVWRKGISRRAQNLRRTRAPPRTEPALTT